MASRTAAGWTFRDLDALSAGDAARGRGGAGYVEVVSARSIQSQVNAQAWTWLDRQTHRLTNGQTTAVAFDSTLEAAAKARRQWMVQHGHAALVDGRYRLASRAARELRQREWQAVDQEHQKKHGVVVAPLPPGSEVRGRYRGTLHLHDGPHALVEGRDRTYRVSVPRALNAPHGSVVVARVLPNARGMVVAARQQAPRRLERE